MKPQIGDTIRFKKYEDLDGREIMFGFYHNMRFLCGTEAKIVDIESYYGIGLNYVLDPKPVDPSNGRLYIISDEMFDVVYRPSLDSIAPDIGTISLESLF